MSKRFILSILSNPLTQEKWILIFAPLLLVKNAKIALYLNESPRHEGHFCRQFFYSPFDYFTCTRRLLEHGPIKFGPGKITAHWATKHLRKIEYPKSWWPGSGSSTFSIWQCRLFKWPGPGAWGFKLPYFTRLYPGFIACSKWNLVDKNRYSPARFNGRRGLPSLQANKRWPSPDESWFYGKILRNCCRWSNICCREPFCGTEFKPGIWTILQTVFPNRVNRRFFASQKRSCLSGWRTATS